MASAASMGVAVRALMIVLLFVMVAAFANLFAVDGYISCFDFSARWGVKILMEFSVYTVVMGAWFFYKESGWIKTIIFTLSMYFLGSLLSIGYILVQFFKLSREESSTNPLYFVLARHHTREHTSRIPVVTVRAIFSALAFLTMGALIYTLIKDISGSYADAFTKCFLANMIDLYIHAVMFAVWIAYKESSWIRASLWIISLLFFGSITLCVYIVRQLFSISPEKPASSIIFSSSDICEPLLAPHANV
ncbi:uncharacterized protein LOC111921475 [Lactuca sativa]|uniref:uncharacterized protein LOC111921475 n=1 Tax=Lactuca sativa TaxID=4236 RepID=UPI000CC3EE0B|nr:uncharacterized protein LOC111921475 [Lactuca sativa]